MLEHLPIAPHSKPTQLWGPPDETEHFEDSAKVLAAQWGHAHGQNYVAQRKPHTNMTALHITHQINSL